MEVAKRVKTKKLYSDSQPSVGVKVLKRKPGKVSLPAASKTKGIKKQIKSKDKVATSTEQNAKPKKAKITKNTKTENEAENQVRNTEAENKVDTTQTIVKKPKGLATAKKTKEGTNTAAGTSKSEVPKKKPKAVNKVQKTEETDKKSNKLIEEIYEAITKHGEPRKGASSQAIKNYIFSKRGIENEDASHKRINKLINNTLRKAVENGDLARPAASKGNPQMPSAAGRFVLAKKTSKPKIPKKPKVEEDGESTE